MLNFALEYRKAIDAITDKRKLGLGEYALEDEEWMLAKQLRDVLKILKDATLYFSRGTPNLTMVIPAMDHIDNVFTNCTIKNENLDPAIRSALGLAKRTLNHYYSCTDSSVVYRIAMVLHPRHKLSYFKAAGWQDDWIHTAEQLVRDEFKRYASHSLATTNNATTVAEVNEVRTESNFYCYCS
ncbi:uncharacterized protein F5147DRAFT_588812 [Suillus discolor]|uniref:hAT-like transposase RNase-H fold domain-containing protein n=1 Tax=Suillus discolor TaxID=1912936 RepID=A0A9P7ES05_9AGAM|nr:uncharacterized protein F5147DRAFT_588812 [Suillus discolor]KAG2085773.1 hypothetical protein F5147DRAFT_588812 [Suillus discolor]